MPIGYSLEVSLLGQIRIEKSPYQYLQTILIETPHEFISVGIKHEVEQGLRDAVLSMTEMLAQQRSISILDAYQVVSHVGNVRLGPMWPFWRNKRHIPVPVCVRLNKEYFVTKQSELKLA